jgi:lysophospholipase L1-like esterase
VTRPDCPWPVFWVGLIVAVCVATPVQAQPSQPPFELKDGDRVVLLGGTFIERDQTYGYLETLLTARYPDRAITFRNLGWSGDTVWGEARSRFGPPAEGFAHLKQHVEALKPTVIFVNYGLNESYAGKAGLPRFEQGLNTLLDVLDKTGARIVMITPRRLEKLPAPLPDPTSANERLVDYVAVLKRAAAERKYRLVDMPEPWKPSQGYPLTDEGSRLSQKAAVGQTTALAGYQLTDNGVHLNERGYWLAATAILKSLGLGPPRVTIDLDSNGSILEGTTSKIEDFRSIPGGISFRGIDSQLVFPISSEIKLHDGFSFRTFRIVGLETGTYEFKIDGKASRGGLLSRPIDEPRPRIDYLLSEGPETIQAEQLRQAINAKNELYFHRWRPQNETYLFGFRKHEQGNNAREIPLFDPLVAAKEAEIARLKVPVTHTYVITRKGEK